MSDKEFAKLQKNNKLTKRPHGSSELKVTQKSDYVLNDLSKRKKIKKDYTKIVKFELESGAAD